MENAIVNVVYKSKLLWKHYLDKIESASKFHQPSMSVTTH